MKGASRLAVGCCAALALFFTVESAALAGPMMPAGSPVGRYTGIVGAGLMGFELVFVVEIAVGIRHPVVIVASSIVGAAGAVVGGYFMERALINAYANGTGPGPVAIAFLGVGMAGTIPTLILFKNTKFTMKKRKKTKKKKKTKGKKGDDAATDTSLEPVPGPAGDEMAPTSFAPRGMITLDADGFFLEPPTITSASSLAPLEAEAYGHGGVRLAETAVEARVTLLRVDF